MSATNSLAKVIVDTCDSVANPSNAFRFTGTQEMEADPSGSESQIRFLNAADSP